MIDSEQYVGCPVGQVEVDGVCRSCDVDADGAPGPTIGCVPPGVVPDCDDTNPSRAPGAVAICGDGVANDCNFSVAGTDAGRIEPQRIIESVRADSRIAAVPVPDDSTGLAGELAVAWIGTDGLAHVSGVTLDGLVDTRLTAGERDEGPTAVDLFIVPEMPVNRLGLAVSYSSGPRVRVYEIRAGGLIVVLDQTLAGVVDRLALTFVDEWIVYATNGTGPVHEITATGTREAVQAVGGHGVFEAWFTALVVDGGAQSLFFYDAAGDRYTERALAGRPVGTGDFKLIPRGGGSSFYGVAAMPTATSIETIVYGCDAAVCSGTNFSVDTAESISALRFLPLGDGDGTLIASAESDGRVLRFRSGVAPADGPFAFNPGWDWVTLLLDAPATIADLQVVGVATGPLDEGVLAAPTLVVGPGDGAEIWLTGVQFCGVP